MADVKLISCSTDALGDPLAEQPFAQANKAATNYVLNSDYFGSSNVATDSITPIGTMRARELIIPAATTRYSVFQTVTVLDNTKVNIYLWVKAPAAGAAIALRMATNNTATWGTGISEKIILTNEWQLLKFSGQASTTTKVKLMLGNIDTDNVADPDCEGKVLICGVSLGDGLAYQLYIPTTTAAASIPALNYTYDSANLDPSDATINLTIDWSGDDTGVIDVGGVALLSVVSGDLVLSDGVNSLTHAITVGIHDVVIELAPTYAAMTVDGGTREVIGYTPIAAGTITVAETFRDFTVNGF